MVKLYQEATVSSSPQNPNDIVNKQYVDNSIGTVTAPVFFTDVTPTTSGIVGNKQFVSGTTPINVVLLEAETDTTNITVEVIAEGPGAFYSPTVTLTGSPALPGEPITIPLTEDNNDKRFFRGAIDLVLTDPTTLLTATSSTGTSATLTINQAPPGPNLTSFQIDSLPIGSNSGILQTETKEGDNISVSGVVPNDADQVEIIPGGATDTTSILTLGAPDSGGVGFKSFTGTFITGTGTGVQSVTARARNSLGTYGDNLVSSNTVVLNQTIPSIGSITIDYPGTQQALKNSEIATVDALVTDFDQINYTTSSDLVVTNPTTYALSKSVQRVAGSYQVGVNNYTITAIKNSNDAIRIVNAAISLADADPIISLSIDGSPSRLRSSPTGNLYTVRLSADQILGGPPSSLDASSGTFIGSWTLDGNDYIRDLSISDSDPKGFQTFSNLSINNLAGIPITLISSGENYETGGFVLREITFDAFQQASDIGTFVTDVTKLSAAYTGSTSLTFYPDLLQHTQGFSIADRQGDDSNALYDPTNRYLWISDAIFAGSNATGTLTLDIEEAE